MTWSVWQFFLVVVKSAHGCWLRCPSCTARDQRVSAGTAAAAQWLRKALSFMRSGKCPSLGGKVWRETQKVLGRHQTGEAEQKDTISFFHVPSKDAQAMENVVSDGMKSKLPISFQKKNPKIWLYLLAAQHGAVEGNTLYEGYKLVQAAFFLITHASFSPTNRTIRGTSPKSSTFHPQTPSMW